MPDRRPLDFNDPRDNVYAFAKLWATFADQPVLSSFHGTMFGLRGDDRLRPLFGYAGIGNLQCKMLDNGHVRLRGKETGYFTDLVTGEVLTHWDNPYTGHTVEVFEHLNDRVRGELGLTMPRFKLGGEDDEPTVMNEADVVEDDAPFILPWQVYGDMVLLAWDYAHRYRNPVTADRWPSAHTGPQINPSEHFTFSTSLSELEDRDCPSATFTAGFSRLSPWWPWMRMSGDQATGVLFGRLFSVKGARGVDDIPRTLLDHAEKNHPEYLEPCEDWDDGQPITLWEAFAREVPPDP